MIILNWKKIVYFEKVTQNQQSFKSITDNGSLSTETGRVNQCIGFSSLHFDSYLLNILGVWKLPNFMVLFMHNTIKSEYQNRPYHQHRPRGQSSTATLHSPQREKGYYILWLKWAVVHNCSVSPFHIKIFPLSVFQPHTEFHTSGFWPPQNPFMYYVI